MLGRNIFFIFLTPARSVLVGSDVELRRLRGRERGKVGSYSLNDEECAVDFSPALG